MSGLVAILGAPGPAEEGAAQRMLDRSRLRGGEQIQRWSGDDGILGITRSAWELGPDFANDVLVLEQEHLVVVADATLYYRDDLRRALKGAGVRPTGESCSHLIAAAYQAWGVRLLEVLEGDFAFALWDRRNRQLLAARDFAGTRPLHFARAGERLILASNLTAVAAHPSVSRELNRLALAEDLIGAASMAVRETAFRDIERLPAGFRLRWQPGSSPVVERFWEPPRFEQGPGPDFREAGEQLRSVLGGAARERLAASGPTTVWMSGGYDSPAVFALAQSAGHAGQSVIPVSMSYPEGDPGREDELISAIAQHRNAEVNWVQIGDVPDLPEPMDWALRRDEPFAHPYESWNLALAAGSRRAGARVVLGGNGGDQFFGLSPVFLADLFRGGRWGKLWGEARAIGFSRHSLRELFHWAVQPALPSGALRLVDRVRGRPLRVHLQSPVPSWMGLDRVTTRALWDRQWTYRYRRSDETLASAEASWYLDASFGQRVVSLTAAMAHQAGAEARSPMYDRRVIEFMARRPRTDRYAGGETKRLLREAMGGLLPAEHLAPRPRRTGLPSAYLQRVRRAALPQWVEAAGSQLKLAELGLVQVGDLKAALSRYLANPKWDGALGGELFNVLAAEFWIRAHSAAASAPTALVA